MADTEELQPVSRPRKAPCFCPMTRVMEEDEQYDYDLQLHPIVEEVDYAKTEKVKQIRVSKDAVTGEVCTQIVPTDVSTIGFDTEAIDHYADWTRQDLTEIRAPDQWAACEESDV